MADPVFKAGELSRRICQINLLSFIPKPVWPDFLVSRHDERSIYARWDLRDTHQGSLTSSHGIYH